MVNGLRYYRALQSISMASALSSALTIYPCHIQVHQRWQSKFQLPTAQKKEWRPATAGSSPYELNKQVEQSGLIYPKLSHTAAVWLAWKSATRRPQSAAPGSREQPTWPVLPAKHQYFTTDECLAVRKVFENYFRLAYLHITISVLIRYNTRLDIRNGTSEIPTLTHADRHINVSFMKISYSQGAEN